MIFAITWFCIVMAIYHILSVILLHQIGYDHITTISVVRDSIRVIIVLCAVAFWYKQIISFVHKRKYLIFWVAITLVYSIIASYRWWASAYNIFIGIKYGFMFLRILLSSLFIWHILPEKHQQTIRTRLPRIVIWIIIGGLIRQAGKYIRPDFFHRLGYGPIGDFVFGTQPPIYYRTWPWWEPRLQGLFAGPNNYGYFLAAFFPLLVAWKKNTRSQNAKLWRIIAIIIAWFSIVLTLSRTAIIGASIGTILLYRQHIRKNKKLLIGIIWAIIIGILWLSVLKGGSTQEHIINKLLSIQYIIQKPRGYGLGTAGPAIHHQWSILPENYYMQMAIDIWSLWFIFFMGTLIILMRTIRQQGIQHNEQEKAMITWFYILLIMWLFLHVFEDSMVNYLFFIPRWIYIGQQAKKQIL